MSRKPTNHPVSSFGIELQNALRAGSNKEVRIEFATPNLALRFNQRINALRAAMRREAHPDADQYYRAGVSISKENPKELIIAPKDSEFRAALKTAGIDAPPLPETLIMTMPTPQPGTSPDSADQFLATLAAATEPPTAAGEVENNPPPSEKPVANK